MDIIKKYNKLTSGTYTTSKAVSNLYHPEIIDEDYQIGYINRYFLRPANQENGLIKEVDAKTFKKFMDNPLFVNAKIRWKIFGPLQSTFNEDGTIKEYGIVHANKRSVELGKKDISNLDKFLVDYTKFYKV